MNGCAEKCRSFDYASCDKTARGSAQDDTFSIIQSLMPVEYVDTQDEDEHEHSGESAAEEAGHCGCQHCGAAVGERDAFCCGYFVEDGGADDAEADDCANDCCDQTSGSGVRTQMLAPLNSLTLGDELQCALSHDRVLCDCVVKREVISVVCAAALFASHCGGDDQLGDDEEISRFDGATK
jgi:hypothetical protein